MCDLEDRHCLIGLVDAVDHPVGAPPGAVAVSERSVKTRADAVGVLQQRAHDELVGSEGNSLREVLRQLSARGWRDDEREPGRLVGHAGRRLRPRMASARCSADSPSPRASSSSEDARRLRAAGSDRIAMVSSSDSRSSGAMRTAEGLPWTVTVTRSCWELTRPRCRRKRRPRCRAGVSLWGASPRRQMHRLTLRPGRSRCRAGIRGAGAAGSPPRRGCRGRPGRRGPLRRSPPARPPPARC